MPHGHDEDNGASAEAMKAARVDLAFRDECAGILIKLNECRRATSFAPWECNHERHAYEKCEYLAYKQRVAAKKAEDKA